MSTSTIFMSRYPGERVVLPREKTLDGLMAFLVKRLSTEQYNALANRAALQGLGLRDYVGRYVLKMVERKFAERRAA